MELILLIIHILICVILIVSILLQASKGGGLAGAFGGTGTSGAIFGSTGAATFLSKLTTYLAVAFFLTCLGLYYLASTDTLPETASERSMEQGVPLPLQTVPRTGRMMEEQAGEGGSETATPPPTSSE
jgi:preprotein translocase subunit SecG